MTPDEERASDQRLRTAYALSVLSILVIIAALVGQVVGPKLYELSHPPAVSPETTAVCCPECLRREAAYQDSLDVEMRNR